MKLLSFACLLGLSLASFAEYSTAQETSFRVYAPSRVSSALLVAQAESRDGHLAFTGHEKIELGFAPVSITQHPEQPILYISTHRGEEDNCPGASLFLDDDGNVKSVVPTKLKHGYAYLSVDRSCQYLLGANYSDGFVDVYSLKNNGEIDQWVFGLNEGRKNAHCILPSPDNRIYIPYVKDTNAIYQYTFNPKDGSIWPLTPKNANPPEGTGPRHLAYHPELRFAYFSNEQGLGVSVYLRENDGQLKLVQVCEAVPQGFDKSGLSSSDIVITPDGKYLFAGIRGHRKDFDRIARYRILEDGKVELLGLTSADKIPWGLHLSPSAHYLLVTAFKGGSLTAFAIGVDGSLSEEATLSWDTNISDLVTR